MNAVKKKLKSQRGASAVIALMFFVVASAVGAIVLSSASANAGRATHALSDQQEYYAVESALKLITDDFASGEMRFPAEEDAEPSGEDAQHLLTSVDLSDGEPKNFSIAPDSSRPGMPEVKGTLEVKCSDATLSFDDIKEKLTAATSTKKDVDNMKLSEKLSLVLDIWAVDPKDSNGKSNPVRITYLPIVTTKNVYSVDEEGDVSGSLVTTISWYQQKMEKGVSAANG